MPKIPIIEPDSEFVMNGQIFKYTLSEGFKLHRIGVYDKKVKPKFIPPTLQEVKDFFKLKGYNETGAIKAFEYYDSAEWKDSKGNQVKNWKQKMIGIWFKPEYKLENTAKKPTTTVNNFFQND